MKRALVFSAVLPVVLVIFFATAGAEKFRHIENFSTSIFKDAANTTAWWDDTAGEIKLYTNVPAIIGSYNTSGSMRGVEIYGDYLFAADGTAGVQVIDISDPAAPTLVATYNTPGEAWKLVADGNYLYVADGISGLQVLDIGNPAAPTLEGSYNTPGTAYGVEISGTHAFIADAAYGLQVINISNPASPTLAGSYNTLGESNGVAIWGDYALVADGSRGLQVFNVINPAAPILIATHDTPGSALEVTVDGKLAYISDFSSGLRIVDISNPASPVLVSTCDTPGDARHVAVSGKQAYVSDYGNGIQVIDVSDPSSPVLSGTCDTPDYAIEIAVTDEHAFVADNNSGLQVIAVRDPWNPQFIREIDSEGEANKTVVTGNYIYVANGSNGLRVYEMIDPLVSSPVLRGTCDTENAKDVTICGKHAFVSDYAAGLKVVDISVPTNPHVVGSLALSGYAMNLAVSGNYAYLAASHGGLHVVDISDPEEPVLITSVVLSDVAYGVAVAGDYAYVVGDVGLQIINISNPAAPTLEGDFDSYKPIDDICLRGRIAYVAAAYAGLIAFDISDPGNPVLIGRLHNADPTRGLDVLGDKAYLGIGSEGLEIVDISDPSNPTLVVDLDTPGNASDVFLSGEYAYISDWLGGVRVIKVLESKVGYDRIRTRGQSIAVNGTDRTISAGRLVTTQTAGVSWELSADGGANWQGVSPDGNWNRITDPGNALLWRSTHVESVLGTNPAATWLNLEWLVDNAVIDSIADLPDDQGGWARVRFVRSAWDFEDSPSPVTSYGIWRRVDDEGLTADLEDAISIKNEQPHFEAESDEGGLPLLDFGGRTFIRSESGLAAATSFPPGTWELVLSVPAVQQDSYLASVPTMVDSNLSGTNHSVFILTTHTVVPFTWYASEPDSGYSIDNIAPGVPLGFAAAFNTGDGNELSWNPSPEEDFQYFRIYRGVTEDFEPGPATLVDETAAVEWNDPDYDGWNVFYKITAVDHAGNESLPASPGMITGDESPAAPKAFALFQNVPNPFNPSTTIRFDLPRPACVKLSIYNVRGEAVATIFDGQMTEGRKEIAWSGRDDGGAIVASGIYFYRLVAGDFTQTRKMVLLK